MRSLIRSFSYALNGIKITINNERNFRIHLTIMLYVMVFSCFYDLSPGEYGVMFLTFSVVLCAEMFNTAIEEIINREFEGYHIMAKVAKDIAAGAVLVCAVGAVIIGIILLFDIKTIVSIILFFATNVVYLAVLFISLMISFMFIMGKFKIHDKK